MIREGRDMEEKRKKRIIVADNDHKTCNVLDNVLGKKEEYDIDFVHDGLTLIKYLKENQDIDAIILDLVMPERWGTSIFNTVRSVSPVSKLVIYTGFPDYEKSVFARKADAFVSKTDGTEKLVNVLQNLLG